MLRNTVCVFAVLSAVGFAEETCSLSGIAVAKSGEPVPNVMVYAGGVRAFRASDYRTAKTDAEGKFSFTALRCGKYFISTVAAGGGAMPLQVDISKQSSIKLVLPDVDPLSLRLGMTGGSTEMGAAKPKGGPEDPAITALRREYMAQLSPQQMSAFERATLNEQRQMYSMAYATMLARLTEPDEEEIRRHSEAQAAAMRKQMRSGIWGRGLKGANSADSGKLAFSSTDLGAQKKLASAAEIVRRSLTAEDGQAFLRGSEAEKSAYFLRAAMAMPAATGICTKFALYLVDVEDSSSTDLGLGSSYLKILGSDDTAQWSNLDTKGRCALIAQGRDVVTRLALSIVRDGSMDQVAGVAKRLGLDASTPHHAVVDMFGSASGEKYNALSSVDEKLQLYKAALLMQLSWSTVYLAL